MNREETLEKAMNAGFEAFRATFRAVYFDSNAATSPNGERSRPGRLARVTERYAPKSWKRDVLEIVRELLVGDEQKLFRFSDFNDYEKQLRRLHPEHATTMSGVAVTLQALMKDSVIRKVARGVYQLA
jgi:hypothetical protein